MEIRIRATGQVMTESEFRASYSNTSFPSVLSAELLDGMDADVVFEGQQPSPTRYQIAYRDGVEQINGKWYTKWAVADMDGAAKATLDAQQAASVRSTRNVMLKDSDWTQVADAPVQQQAWQTYRQALRDITAQSGFPWDITWPVAPT